MRKVSAAALILIALCAGPAGAEDLKAFKLTIDGDGRYRSRREH
ncbi:hypothetical protein [Mesorhizobium sp. M1342]